MAGLGVELIEFVRPYHNDVNLYVTNISRRLDKETVQVSVKNLSLFCFLTKTSTEIDVWEQLQNAGPKLRQVCLAARLARQWMKERGIWLSLRLIHLVARVSRQWRNDLYATCSSVLGSYII